MPTVKHPTDPYSIANLQFQRYEYARDNGHLDFVRRANLCDEYFLGHQWSESDRRTLEAQGKPVLTINKVKSTISVVMGEQLRNRVDVAFRPMKDGTEEVAHALSKVYIQIANNNDLEHVESDVASDGFITGRGFYDIRMGFDDHMMGEVKISRLNPRNVLLDPDAYEYDPGTWKEVFVTKWMTVDEIELLYGKAKAEKLKTRNVSDFKHGLDSAERFHGTFGGSAQVSEGDYENTNTRRKIRVIERQYKKLRNAWWFVDVTTGDMRMIPEDWSDERRQRVANTAGLAIVKRLSESIRWTVTADDETLFDAWSPYKYFTVVPFYPYLQNGVAVGLVEDLISPQDQLNKASSQELHIINTTANSGYKVKSGSLRNMDIEDIEERGAQTGVVFELDNVDDLEKLQPNQVPTGHDRVTYKSDEFIKEISGISDSLRGMDRADVAAKAIQAKQSAGAVNLAKPFDNLTRTRHLVAVRVLSLVQTYYTEERVIQIIGRDVNASTEEVVVNQATPEGTIANDLTLGEYAVVITNVPTRDEYDSSQFQEALELRQLGLAIPDDVLIEYSHLSRKTEIAERIRELRGEGEANEAEQQAAQLEMQTKQSELEQSEADTRKTAADAALTAMKVRQLAQELQQESEEGLDDEQQLEREKILSELRIKKYEIDERNKMEREKLEKESQLERDKLAMQRQVEMMKAAVQRSTNKNSGGD